MKSVFISYNQALNDRVMQTLDRQFIRGFSKWELTHGRGTQTGEPHYGSHAWPAMNSSIMAIMEDEKVPALMQALKAINDDAPQQGLRAFVWNIEEQI